MMISLVVNESFLDPILAGKIWTKSITDSKIFWEQIEQRRILLDRLNEIIACLPRPDMSLEIAIKQGHINKEQATKLFASLSDLLEFNPEYRRIVLYLPFEFLPSKTWHPSEEILQQASDRFKQAYMKAWKDLLFVQDVRANFLDGDVLEVEQRVGDLPRVVKAAHLIPKLVEKGLIEIKDIVALMEESSDRTLRNSIAATLPVLADLDLITEKEFELMEKSTDYYISSIARIIHSDLNTESKKTKAAPRTITLSFVQEELTREFSRIDATEYGNITKRRKDWLIESEKQKVIKTLAETISAVVVENGIANESIGESLNQEIDIAIIQTLIEGIRNAIELTVLTDPDRALEVYERHQNTLLRLWESDNNQINETLLKTFRHLYHLRIIDDKQLAKLNIVIPELAGSFSRNLKLIPKELVNIDEISELIKSDPELSELIYPIVLVYGSRLKGYGAQHSDVDVGIFVRPGISFDNRSRLLELLGNVFTEKIVQDGIIEFWLEEKNEILQVRNFDKSISALAESHWTHYLFCSAWNGDENNIYKLLEKLLVPYLYDTDKIIQGLNARKVYLEVLETSLLQYRLMHTGYELFFPQYGGINTLHADEIDGRSMFWDSGYRQLATKLFVGKVFLPKISTAKNRE